MGGFLVKEGAIDCLKVEERLENSEGTGRDVAFAEFSTLEVTFPSIEEKADVAFPGSTAFEVRWLRISEVFDGPWADIKLGMPTEIGLNVGLPDCATFEVICPRISDDFEGLRTDERRENSDGGVTWFECLEPEAEDSWENCKGRTFPVGFPDLIASEVSFPGVSEAFEVPEDT